ncbi:MAG: MBL fold metallo-hydrolase [Bryobacteraceae bacterium]
MRTSSLLRLTAAVVLCGGAWVAYTQQAAPQLKINKLKDNLFEIENDGGNVTVYITNEGVILVDDKFERDHDQIMSLVKSVTNQPIRYVINTHHHGDHTGGNAKLLPMSVQIVSSEEARENMVDGKMPGLPGMTIAGHGHIYLGGKTVEMYHYGRAHTNGDTVVLFPEHRILASGDMFTRADTVPAPLIDYAGGGSAKEWTKTIDDVTHLDFETVIPGHGPVGVKQDMLPFRTNIATIRDRVHQMVVEKKNRDEIGKVLASDFKFNQLQLTRGLDGLIAEMQ